LKSNNKKDDINSIDDLFALNYRVCAPNYLYNSVKSDNPDNVMIELDSDPFDIFFYKDKCDVLLFDNPNLLISYANSAGLCN